MNTIVYVIGFILNVAVMLYVMPKFIKKLKSLNINQVTSEYALEDFKQKEKTPIMGGLLFVVIPIITFILIDINALSDRKLLFVMFSYVLYCLVGFLDDYTIVVKHNNEGLSQKSRLIMELVFAAGLFFVFQDIIPQCVTIPFTTIGVQLPWFVFVPFMVLLYMAEANAVNFTDGMDGLCAGVSFIALIPMLVFTLIAKEYHVSLFICCILGGLTGYLKFNFHPAKIFMGDSGSVALGALFAALGLMMDKTIALFFIGGTFVVEMFCVVLQQLSVRLFHKRVFSYTPIHYAYVIKGYKEKNIVIGFYLFTLVLALIGLFIGLNTL
ncbi:MAG: phospho-N-acetylmuramoyl-pentapeptide-transferase [Erysipelotrichaceae bacterium]|nr:phospho-N-acetylmuramoyl-pentapeptide-transferase [Erysipelotrichaceae bacterium]